MDKKGKGKKLYDMLGEYKTDMLNILNPADYTSELLNCRLKSKAEKG